MNATTQLRDRTTRESNKNTLLAVPIQVLLCATKQCVPTAPNVVGPFGVRSYPVFGPGRSVYSWRRNGSSKSGIFPGTTLLTCTECKQRAVSLSTAQTNSRRSFPFPFPTSSCCLMHPEHPASTPLAQLHQPCAHARTYHHHGEAIPPTHALL